MEADAPAGDVEESKLSEEEKALMREEFEAGLLDAGLQIERDKEVCIIIFLYYSTFTMITFPSAAWTFMGQSLSDLKASDWTAAKQVEDKTGSVVSAHASSLIRERIY